jgi:hypothetical protein
MKKINIKWLMMTIIMFSLSSCILEDVEPEYDVVGGIASITSLTPSKTNPTAGEAMTVSTLYYSEHAPVVELRFYARVGVADRVLVETVSIQNHNTQDSYTRTFNYTVPAATPAATLIVFTVEVETPKSLIATRSTPATGAAAVRVI